MSLHVTEQPFEGTGAYKAGLSIVPVVPWEAPADTPPPINCNFLPRCVDDVP